MNFVIKLCIYYKKALILLCIFGIISCSKENGNLIPSTELDDNAYDTTRKFLHVNYGWGGNNDGAILMYLPMWSTIHYQLLILVF